MKIRDQIIELYQTFFPYRGDTGQRKISKKEWEKTAHRLFNVLSGMVIGNQATVEQLKEIKEILRRLESKP